MLIKFIQDGWDLVISWTGGHRSLFLWGEGFFSDKRVFIVIIDWDDGVVGGGDWRRRPFAGGAAVLRFCVKMRMRARSKFGKSDLCFVQEEQKKIGVCDM